MNFGELLKEPATKAIYRFNGDLLADSSGNGLPLINQGSVALTNLGRFGQGADFGNTGDNGKYLYNNSNLNATLSNDITILFWVYPKSQPTAGNRRFLDYRTGTAYLLVNYEVNPTRQLRIACNGTDAVLVGELTLNTWYFFGITISTAGVVTLYINGVARATGTRAAAAVGNTFVLGNCLQPTNFNIGATYDEVHIIQRLWSPVEIQKAYTYMKGWF